MRKLVALLWVLLPLLAHSQSLEKLDEKYGFRDVVFEKPVSVYKGMVYLKPGDNGQKLYQRKTDKLTIGQYKISNLNYGFYNGKLSDIYFMVSGFHSSEGVLNILQNQYGEGEELIDYTGSYIWGGEKANMTFLQDQETGNTTVHIVSKKMEKMIFDAKQKKEQSATSDL